MQEERDKERDRQRDRGREIDIEIWTERQSKEKQDIDIGKRVRDIRDVSEIQSQKYRVRNIESKIQRQRYRDRDIETEK